MADTDAEVTEGGEQRSAEAAKVFFTFHLYFPCYFLLLPLTVGYLSASIHCNISLTWNDTTAAIIFHIHNLTEIYV